MTWTQEWYIKDRIVLVRFSGTMTTEEIRDSFACSVDFINRSTQDMPVHFLHDWSQLERFPRNLAEIRGAFNTQADNPKKVGVVVMFGHDNSLLKFLADVAFRLFKIKFFAFQTAEEAIEFLRQTDKILPTIPLPVSAAESSDLADSTPSD